MTSPQDGGESTAPAGLLRPIMDVPTGAGRRLPPLVTILGVPRPQGSMRAVMIRGFPQVVHKSAKMKAWREHIRAEVARVWECPPIDGPVRLDRYFVLPAPQNRPGREKPNRELPAVRPDLDKLDRALWDALTGVCWTDDARIVGGCHWKVYGSPPRVIYRFAAVTLAEVLAELPFRPSP